MEPRREFRFLQSHVIIERMFGKRPSLKSLPCSIPAGAGPDARADLHQVDLLGHQAVAKSIYAYIKSADLASSIRVGLIGQWGSGKTGILAEIDRLAILENAITAYVQLWNLSSAEAVREAVLRAVLDRVNSSISTSSIKVKIAGFMARAREHTSAISALTGLGHPSVSALGISVASVVSQLVRLNQKDQQRLQEEIGSRKVILFIDDLDRLDPQLVPSVLMVLRDGLDVPGFNYVISFDDRVVLKALESGNDAWKDGQDFLDKIIDTPFLVPPLSVDSAMRVLEHTLNRQPFATYIKQFNWLPAALPDNPRKIKQLARRFAAAWSNLSRLEVDEYQPDLIMLCECLRTYSPRLLESFIRLREDDYSESFDEDDVSPDLEMDLQSRLQVDLSSVSSRHRDRVRKLLDRASKILTGVAPEELRAHALATEEIPIITLREIRLLSEQIRAGSSPNFETWLTEQRRFSAADEVVAAVAVAQAAMRLRARCLSAAADIVELENHSSSLVLALPLLQIVRASAEFVLRRSGTSTQMSPVLSEYLRHIGAWHTFDKNPSEPELRHAEKELARHLFLSDRIDPTIALRVLEPWRRELMFERGDSAFETALANDCVERIWKVVEEQLEKGEVPSFVSEMTEPVGRFALVESEYCLLSNQRAVSFASAVERNARAQSCREFCWLALQQLRELVPRSPKLLELIRLSDQARKLLFSLWQVSTRAPWQFRFQKSAREIEGFLSSIDVITAP